MSIFPAAYTLNILAEKHPNIYYILRFAELLEELNNQKYIYSALVLITSTSS